MSQTITLEQVARKAVELADARPDFIYEAPMGKDQWGDVVKLDCEYLHRDEEGQVTPGCLYGHVLLGLGLSVERLGEFEQTGISTVMDSLDPDRSPWPVGLLGAVVESQGNQDNGQPWGEAIQPVKDALAAMEAAK